MRQPSLFGNDIVGKPRPSIVNVASVPMRSPFRYAGGKTWLIPWIRRWLAVQGGANVDLIEPFAGGAIVGLTAAFENLVRHVTLVELDDDVAAVWQVILSEDAQWLADAIMRLDLTHESIRRVIADSTKSICHRAFATIVRNRTMRGGILAEGAGFLKHGENGKGLRSRWYPATLKRRILDIHHVRDKISFIHGDAFAVCRANASRDDVVYFIDPPYTQAGRRLYTHSEINHAELFALAAELRGGFLMTYDDAPEIRQLAAQYGFQVDLVPMKSTHHAAKYELLIGRNLDWLAEQ